ncbi:hypothetical protein CHS0354_008296 [Potamilus streckersoni]|uniref:TIR domain-containing protein n=1 Tax=Potamilus streckersoni TaxID=2493646 RepID=A0AAE0RQR5_9BIVA|nr:hypothetical protein CHS0354_008296 [Potamilus streckersoni]
MPEAIVMFLQLVVYLCLATYSSSCITKKPESFFSQECNQLKACGCRNFSLVNMTSVTLNRTECCYLDLRKNKIKLYSGIFNEWVSILGLDLSDNILTEIPMGSFDGLSNLKYLRLQNTNLSLMSEGSFRGLNIQCLDLTINNFRNFEILTRAVTQIYTLQNLYVEGCDRCEFDKSWKKLKNLTSLDLSGYSPNHNSYKDCHITRLSLDTFINLPYLRNLSLSDCAIEDIEPGTFAHLTHLEYLDISQNSRLNFTGAAKGLRGLNATNVKWLNMNHINSDTGLGTMITKTLFETFIGLPLEELYLDANKLEIFEQGAIPLLPKSLKKVSVAYNRLALDDYLEDVAMDEDGGKNLQSLEYADCSYQQAFSALLENQMTQDSEIRKRREILPGLTWVGSDLIIVIAPPSNVKVIKFRESSWHLALLAVRFENNSIEEFDLSNNNINSWIGPVEGLGGLKRMYLSNNNCINVSNSFFTKFRALEVLDISQNFLGDILNDGNHGEVFSGLDNLKYLDISLNRIRFLPKMILKGLRSLETLNMSQNFLAEFDIDLSSCLRLRILNLTQNQIYLLTNDVQDKLETASKTSPVTVLLQQNSLSCTCDALDFLSWKVNTRVNLTFGRSDTCRISKGQNIKLANFDNTSLTKMKKQCTSYTLIIAASVGLFLCFLTVIFSAIAYRYRWKIRYLYYIARSHRAMKHYYAGYRTVSAYDSFICYANEDVSFVRDEIIPRLEGQDGLRLCLADREFIPGVSISENIVNAIVESRTSIFIMTSSFLRSHWCKYEINIARVNSIEKDTDSMIMVMLEDIPNNLLPLEILELFRSQTYLDYPKTAEERETFWKALSHAVQREA